MKKIKLFCIPYAGGSAMIYNSWKKHLNQQIEIHFLELAGRGIRFNDSLYESFDSAVNDIFKLISENLDDGEYALYGHSLGSILAYELVYKLKKAGYAEPVHIFFSGRYPPEIKKEDEKICHNLPNDEFKKEIMNMGATPAEVFDNKELSEIFVPILRADYKIVEDYKYIPKDSKIGCDITIFSGKDDNVTIGDLEEWKGYTEKVCNIYQFEGGHFFIFDHEKEIVDIINYILLSKQ